RTGRRAASVVLERARRVGGRGGTASVLRGHDAREGPADSQSRSQTGVARTVARAERVSLSARHRAGACEAAARRRRTPEAGRSSAEVVVALVPRVRLLDIAEGRLGRKPP